MRFDEFWTDDDQAGEQKPADLQMLPDGTHHGKVKVAKWSEVEWKKTDDNPKGLCLTLCVEVPGYREVWADCPVTWRGLIEAVCRACGQHPPTKGEDWDCEVLKGEQVGINTLQCVAKSGKQYVRIDKWIAGPKPLPKEVAARPAAKKVAKEPKPDFAPDDIPF